MLLSTKKDDLLLNRRQNGLFLVSDHKLLIFTPH